MCLRIIYDIQTSEYLLAYQRWRRTIRTSSDPSSWMPARFASSFSQCSTTFTRGCHHFVSGPNASASSSKKLNCGIATRHNQNHLAAANVLRAIAHHAVVERHLAHCDGLHHDPFARTLGSRFSQHAQIFGRGVSAKKWGAPPNAHVYVETRIVTATYK